MDTPIFDKLRRRRQLRCPECFEHDYPYWFFMCEGWCNPMSYFDPQPEQEFTLDELRQMLTGR